MKRRGYVLLETVGALVVLSVGIVGVHQAMREAVMTRAQARDYTQARFLLQALVAQVELQPLVYPGEYQGAYADSLSRFRWKYKVDLVQLPEMQPSVQAVPRPSRGRPMIVRRQPVTHMGRITAEVSWTLRNQEYSQRTQTLMQPEKVFRPDASEQPPT